MKATEYNGMAMNDTCFYNESSGYDRVKLGNPVFLIGDWGGILYPNSWSPVPADHTKTHDPNKRRSLNWQVDTSAQERVAGAFNARGKIRNPDYIINVGDNFYWGGVNCDCGNPCTVHCDVNQWAPIFENLYKGKGIDGVQWLGVLGNHDYGGWQFNKAWDQVIAYTWTGGKGYTNRWIQPAVYYRARVFYTGFAVDWFFVDSNIFDVKTSPWIDPEHNICGSKSGPSVGCAASGGPVNEWACFGWFSQLWGQQQSWLDGQLRNSVIDKVDWQFVVTHFPVWWGQPQWQWLAARYGVDIFITGHVHRQDIFPQWVWWNQFKPSSLVITGGGGGITSEYFPNVAGYDDQYGFVDMTLWKDKVKLEAISHGSIIRKTEWVTKRAPQWQPNLRCATGLAVRIKSFFGNYLTDDNSSVQVKNVSGSEQEWTMKEGANGRYLFTSRYKKQLMDTNGQGFMMSSDDRTWQSFKLIDAGDGKVFITSFRDSQLTDAQGYLKEMWDKGDWQKWTITNVDGSSPCEVKDSPPMPKFSTKEYSYHRDVGSLSSKSSSPPAAQAKGSSMEFDCEEGKNNWESG